MGALDRVLDRMQLRRAPQRPAQVHMAVTDRCFLPCLHCDIWKNKTPDLEGAIWSKLIDELGQWCAPAGMNFVGGEPLLRKDLEALMGQAVRAGFEVSFNTNGWLVSDARARAISEAGVSVAYVSLDGMNRPTVDHSRGREGSFDKGLYFKIPFNGIFPGNSKSSYAAIMRPLERDGGRRLEDFSGSLWFARRNVRYDAFANNKNRMVP